MKKHSPTTPTSARACPSARRKPSTSVLGRAALAGALALGWHGAIFANLDDVDGSGGGDAKDKKTVVQKAPDARVKFSVFIEGGITGNPNDPDDHQNFGRVFDDRSNEPMLNQATVTVERALAPEPGKFDYGFKFQAGGGSDGRFINTLGTLENVSNGIIQPYVVEAYGNLHLPFGPEAGIDFRFGQFATLLGAETIDPRTNYFYSHDYIFNFGIPLQHLGGLFTVHASPIIDIYAGVTRGVNTSIYDNNGKAAFLGGVGVNNILGGKVTLLLTTHIGPENPRESTGAPSFHGGTVESNDFRLYNDLVVTYKATDKLTSITEGVYTYDAGFDTEFYGVAETLAYTVTDKITAAVRFEGVRDSDGFFVAQFAANDDFTNVERGGIPLDPRTVGGGPNNYLEATVGVQVKPLKFLTVRPEVRFDYATDQRAFDDSSKHYSVTVGADAIIAF